MKYRIITKTNIIIDELRFNFNKTMHETSQLTPTWYLISCEININKAYIFLPCQVVRSLETNFNYLCN